MPLIPPPRERGRQFWDLAVRSERSLQTFQLSDNCPLPRSLSLRSLPVPAYWPLSSSDFCRRTSYSPRFIFNYCLSCPRSSVALPSHLQQTVSSAIQAHRDPPLNSPSFHFSIAAQPTASSAAALQVYCPSSHLILPRELPL